MNRAALQREKLLNAMIFFTKNTRHCHKLKLFKLLFFLDVEVYRETGKTCTGLRYFAWPAGPVPNKLFDELKSPGPDLRAALSRHREFDDSCFTARELVKMAQLADVYRDARGKAMTDVSLWHTVYVVEQRHQAEISFELALDGKPGSVTKQQAAEIKEEERELAALFDDISRSTAER
ncbi:MAG: type II toxin-antitoxin system antitoxin SocA domain-containing protein [Candidatus Sigynarchaeota archaeon]|jgi:uncharacterized phage-associated protein